MPTAPRLQQGFGVAFNGDVCRDLAAHFLTLAEKQGAKVPLMIGHFVMATTLLLRGIPEAREHYDQAIVLYDPMEAIVRWRRDLAKMSG